MEDLIIFGVPVAFIITAIIQVLKRGWPTVFNQPRWAITAAIVTGLALGVIVALAQSCGAFDCWAKSILGCLLAALASIGAYDTIRTAQAQVKSS